VLVVVVLVVVVEDGLVVVGSGCVVVVEGVSSHAANPCRRHARTRRRLQTRRRSPVVDTQLLIAAPQAREHGNHDPAVHDIRSLPQRR
jgi:hypothetical protein